MSNTKLYFHTTQLPDIEYSRVLRSPTIPKSDRRVEREIDRWRRVKSRWWGGEKNRFHRLVTSISFTIEPRAPVMLIIGRKLGSLRLVINVTTVTYADTTVCTCLLRLSIHSLKPGRYRIPSVLCTNRTISRGWKLRFRAVFLYLPVSGMYLYRETSFYINYTSVLLLINRTLTDFFDRNNE